jgi:hypothetical protein
MVESLPGAKILAAGPARPWPGFLNIPGRSPLGILLQPGTTIEYSWNESRAVELDLLCGVGVDAYTPGVSRRFDFNIVQKNSKGTAVVEFRSTLNPGIQPSDRRWQPVHLSLKGGDGGGGLLEFGCASDDPSALGTAGLAEAVLRHPIP